MKLQTGLAVAAVVITLSTVMVHAADEPLATCALWKRMTDWDKTMFLFGWVQSMDMAREIAQSFVDGPVVEKTLKNALWPKGHQLGSVILQMNIQCDKPENRDRSLGNAMLDIALKVK